MKENRRIEPTNKYNFVRFTPALSTALLLSKYAANLHNGRQYRWRNICDVLPILRGDILTIHTNFNQPIIAATSSFKIIDADGNIIENNTDYSVVSEQIGTTDNYILTLTVPNTSTKVNGDQIRIGIVVAGVALFVSNVFEIHPYTEESIRGTHLISFTHDNNIYSYNWEELDPDKKLYTIRVASNVNGISYPSEDSIYKSSTTGRPRKTRSILDKAYIFETYYASEYFHDAFNMSVHLKDFYVNGNKMIKDGSYELAYNNIFNLSKGTVTLIDTRYAIRVNRCSDFVPPEPPLADPVVSYLLKEISGDPSVFIDANLRIIVNEVEVETVFTDGESGVVVLSDNDLVRFQYFYLGNLIDEGTTSPTIRIVVTEDGNTIVNESILITDTTVGVTGNESITVSAGSVYTVVVDSFDAG
jgi:hypothetical protein